MKKTAKPIKKPNPGSEEAVEKGCLCPVLDNAYGQGAWGSRGKRAVFWVNHACPLHSPVPKLDKLEE